MQTYLCIRTHTQTLSLRLSNVISWINVSLARKISFMHVSIPYKALITITVYKTHKLVATLVVYLHIFLFFSIYTYALSHIMERYLFGVRSTNNCIVSINISMTQKSKTY